MSRYEKRSSVVLFSILGVGMFAGMSSSEAARIELLTNGGFESADFSAWSIFEAGGSALFVDATTTSPASGFTTAGPASGSHYAVADGALGATSLIQNFTTDPGSNATLRFDMFVASGAPSVVDPSGLDHTTDGSFDANQHARVDVLSAGADPRTTSVLASYYLGIDGPLEPGNPYRSYAFDLSAITSIGGTYQLRFAQVNNQDFLIQGIDDVSISVDGTPVSAPVTLSLFGIGLLGLSAARWRKHA